jgi:predicted transcriptional regulator
MSGPGSPARLGCVRERERRAPQPPTWAKAMGERLRQIRSERGESLASVAKVTGLSSSFLSMLEHGMHVVDVDAGHQLLTTHPDVVVKTLLEAAASV